MIEELKNFWNNKFKKHPVAWFFILFGSSQVIIFALYTLYFLFTGLGLFSSFLWIMVKGILVFGLLIAIVLLPIYLLMWSVNKVSSN